MDGFRYSYPRIYIQTTKVPIYILSVVTRKQRCNHSILAVLYKIYKKKYSRHTQTLLGNFISFGQAH